VYLFPTPQKEEKINRSAHKEAEFIGPMPFQCKKPYLAILEKNSREPINRLLDRGESGTGKELVGQKHWHKLNPAPQSFIISWLTACMHSPKTSIGIQSFFRFMGERRILPGRQTHPIDGLITPLTKAPYFSIR